MGVDRRGPTPGQARRQASERNQMTQAQLADAYDKFKNNREGAAQAVRVARSHVLFPVEGAAPGKPLDLGHLAITARERAERRL
jgi:uncharacterized protein